MKEIVVPSQWCFRGWDLGNRKGFNRRFSSVRGSQGGICDGIWSVRTVAGVGGTSGTRGTRGTRRARVARRGMKRGRSGGRETRRTTVLSRGRARNTDSSGWRRHLHHHTVRRDGGGGPLCWWRMSIRVVCMSTGEEWEEWEGASRGALRGNDVIRA